MLLRKKNFKRDIVQCDSLFASSLLSLSLSSCNVRKSAQLTRFAGHIIADGTNKNFLIIPAIP